MINTALGLSKLSRGIGEKKGPLLQISYDELDYFDIKGRKKTQDNKLSSNNSVAEQRELHLPKTFSTRKGPLILFSEDLTLERNEEDRPCPKPREKQNKPLRTFGDLRRSILEFGVDDSDDWIGIDRLSDKEKSDQVLIEKIRPGFSAKRYLSNWTRKWKPDLLENLAKRGSLKEESLFENSDMFPKSKSRIDDDLSRIPPAYRIQDKWLSMNIPALRGYRFYRLESTLSDRQDGSINNLEINTEGIQICDQDGNGVEYDKLSKPDKEAVLTELLIQTAIQSITEKRIVFFL